MGRASRTKTDRRALRPRPEVAGVLERVHAYGDTCEAVFGSDCFERMDARMVAGRGDKWPAWCPMPAGAVYAMAESMRETEFGDRVFHNLIPMLHSLWLWRFGEGIYRFDDAMAAALLDTPLSAALPGEVLTRLPEWCPFLVAPSCEGWPEDIAGVFVCHSWNADAGRRELRLVYLPSTPDVPLMSIIPLNFATLDEALDAWCAHTREVTLRDGALDHEATEKQLARAREAVTKVIGLVLYLCAQNAELRAVDEPGRPLRPVEPPVPSARPREILVGYRTGPLLSRRRGSSGAATGSGRAVEPHLRRAHWHHYWVGPEEGPDRHLELRWLGPTLVNGRPVRPRLRDLRSDPAGGTARD